MKRVSFIFSLLLITTMSLAQNTYDTVPPYKRSPVVPEFKLLGIDSVSYLTKDKLKKNKPVLIIIFNPDCDHCKHETEEILKHMDDLKKVQIVMATMAQFAPMMDFYKKYKLEDYKNIKVGRDLQYMLPTFYRAQSLPYLAMYDKEGNLLTTFQGTMKIEELIDVFKD